ncbi:MAG: enoyl-CoA hydratase-related protein [Bdellovibrionota bacterium]
MTQLIIERDNHICSLKLNRPEKLNALSWDLIDELTLTLKELAKEATEGKIRCLLLGSSNHKAFCAGADLKERMAMTEEKVVQTLDKLKLLMGILDDFPTPTIAVMEGIAFGGGLELALACDLRVAHVAASMGLTEVNLAIIPGAGGTQRLTRIVGEAKSKRMIFLAEKLNSQDAHKEGLVHTTSPDPWKKALHWAGELVLKGPLALRFAKEAISSGRSLSIEEAIDVERACYMRLLSSEDRIEGLKAFIEKRSPAYKGH